MPDPVTNEQVMEAVDQVRKSYDGLKEGLVTKAEFKGVETSTADTLKRYDDENQKVVADLKAAEKLVDEQKDRLDELELVVSKQAEAPQGAKDYKEGQSYKDLQNYLRYGKKGLMEHEDAAIVEIKTRLDAALREQKTLRTDIDTQGGYLVPTEMAAEIIRKITEISPIRNFARVRTVGKKTIELPKRGSLPDATWEGETASGSQSQSSYESETLTANRLTSQIPVTIDMIMDSAFDMDSEISADVTEKFNQKEGAAFVSGDGAKKPEGFLVNSEVVAGASTTAGSGVIVFDDLITVTGELKTGYNPMWGFNRRTLANIRTLKDGAGQYAWQPGMEVGGSQAATLLGDPYALIPDMPDIAASALSVIYGDFARGYVIIDRTGMEMVRDELTQALAAILLLTFRKYTHGQVVNAEAFKALKIKA